MAKNIEEIKSLPEKYRPLSPWAYFGYSILFNVPIIGFIFLIIKAFSGNVNTRNFARSYFCLLVVVAILIVAILVLGGSADLIAKLTDIINSATPV